MCNNRKYSKEEQKRIDQMKDYAMAILQGETLEDVAATNDVTIEEVKSTIEEILKINPGVYYQVKKILET